MIQITRNSLEAPYIANHLVVSATKDEFTFEPEETARARFLAMPGQIQRSCALGQALYRLARTKGSPRLWLEVGTWNGLGSTACILDGFAERLSEDPRLLSYEIDPVMVGAAQQNLATHSAIRNVDFIQNKLVSGLPVHFPEPEELPNDEVTCAHFLLHYRRERALYEAACGYLPVFSPQVALLDGGEYSGRFDWLHLDKTDLEWVFLDDTHTLKHSRICKELNADPSWTLVESGKDRNGWAVFQKRT